MISSFLRSLDAVFDFIWINKAINISLNSYSENEMIKPKVGVVIAIGLIEVCSTFRNQNGRGGHAEYIALDEAAKGKNLDRATLYTTLEPCTERNIGKIPCVYRIIERKIKRVVIGMLDPNPEIQGKGERFLRENGISVDRFSDVFVRKVSEINKEWRKIFPLELPLLTNEILIGTNSSLEITEGQIIAVESGFDSGRVLLFLQEGTRRTFNYGPCLDFLNSEELKEYENLKAVFPPSSEDIGKTVRVYHKNNQFLKYQILR